jgi:hypothetical protein
MPRVSASVLSSRAISPLGRGRALRPGRGLWTGWSGCARLSVLAVRWRSFRLARRASSKVALLPTLAPVPGTGNTLCATGSASAPVARVVRSTSALAEPVAHSRWPDMREGARQQNVSQDFPCSTGSGCPCGAKGEREASRLRLRPQCPRAGHLGRQVVQYRLQVQDSHFGQI